MTTQQLTVRSCYSAADAFDAVQVQNRLVEMGWIVVLTAYPNAETPIVTLSTNANAAAVAYAAQSVV